MYALIDPRFPVVLLAVTIISYCTARLIQKSQREPLKTNALRIGIVVLLAILFASKYLGFFIANINTVISWVSNEKIIKSLEWIFPVGVSFFIFQAISYLVDTYNGKFQPENNFAIYALYLAFFPKLLIGPIERGDDLIPQLRKPAVFRYESFISNLVRILWGLWKKFVVADRFAAVANTVFSSPSDFYSIKKLAAVFAISVQIYLDFSSYCDMAIGTAGLIGVKLRENFNFPYFAQSITEFWRRWHITLSNFLQDYIFMPLSFKHRRKKNRKIWTALDILFTFLVSGLWHGANWTFIVWGLLHGLIQASEFLFKDISDKINARIGIDPSKFAYKLVRTLGTFGLVSFLWIFFTADTLATAFNYIISIFTLDGITAQTAWNFADGSLGLDGKDLFLAIIGLALILILEFNQYKQPAIWKLFYQQPTWFRWTIYYGLLISTIVFGYYGESVYQEFVYFNF